MSWEDRKVTAFLLTAIVIVLLPCSLSALAQQVVEIPEESSAPYESDGHLYTTFIVARLAGIEAQRAANLAWGSQIPDERMAFNAITGAVEHVVGSTLGRRLMSTLHSLHGGDETEVLKRRRDLHDLLATGLRNGSLPDWQAGLIIHSYGDSYAHTRSVNGHLQAYGDWTGHLFDGHTPDSIRAAPDKYLEFANGLFFCLKGRNANHELDGLAEKAKHMPNSQPQAVAEMQGYAASLGLTIELDETAKQNLLKRVQLKEVEDTMTLMERKFSEVPENNHAK